MNQYIKDYGDPSPLKVCIYRKPLFSLFLDVIVFMRQKKQFDLLDVLYLSLACVGQAD